MLTIMGWRNIYYKPGTHLGRFYPEQEPEKRMSLLYRKAPCPDALRIRTAAGQSYCVGPLRSDMPVVHRKEAMKRQNPPVLNSSVPMDSVGKEKMPLTSVSVFIGGERQNPYS